MNFGKTTCCVGLLSVALLIAVGCNTGTAQGGKTEVLPADGGDLGKAFVTLQNAFKTADKATAAKHLDPNSWHLDNKDRGWFAQIYDAMGDYSVDGGRRQGDHATLFVANKQPFYAMFNATRVSGGWQFDSPLPLGSSFSYPARDCKAWPTRFPCGAQSAPDARVSGTVQSHKIDPETKSPFPPVTLFDGLAARMLDGESKALKSTWVVLSGTGINPQMVSLSEDPDHVKMWLNYPTLTLDIAPDGKSARAQYNDGYSPKAFDVTSGLSIDMKAPSRISGSLKTDVKGVAKFDITFDIGTASDCLAGKYNCTD